MGLVFRAFRRAVIYTACVDKMGNDASKEKYGEIVYEDSAVRILERAIEVKKYYSCMNSKIVPIEDIEEVSVENRGGRLWGLSLGSNIWWAIGKRKSIGTCVLKLKGHSLRVGFDICVPKTSEEEKEKDGARKPRHDAKHVIETIKKLVQENKSK